MYLAPFTKQTLVSSFSKDQVLAKIRSKTKLVQDSRVIDNPVFNGTIKSNKFRLSLAVTYSQNSLPLAMGTVEDTTRGSIIFLHLRLFPAAILYLIFFTTLALFIGLVFLILSKSPLGLVVAISLALANYLILNINFHRKAYQTIDSFKEILSREN